MPWPGHVTPRETSGETESRAQDGRSGQEGPGLGSGESAWPLGRALTIPAALARSGLLGAKLPLWLVDTVLGFLLLSPMASMDWLRLRITRCEGGLGGLEARAS